MDGSKPDYIFATRTLYHTMGNNAIFLCALASFFSKKDSNFRFIPDCFSCGGQSLLQKEPSSKSKAQKLFLGGGGEFSLKKGCDRMTVTRV